MTTSFGFGVPNNNNTNSGRMSSTMNGVNSNGSSSSMAVEEDVDFGSLLSSSSSLRNKSSAFGSSSVMKNKSLKEIEVASNALFSNQQQQSQQTFAQEASAHRLLAREGGGFDSARLGRFARDLEVRNNNNNNNNNNNTTTALMTVPTEPQEDVALYLQSAQTTLIQSILQEQKQVAQNQEQKMEETLLQNWKQERSRMLSHILHGRTLGTTTGTTQLPSSTKHSFHDWSTTTTPLLEEDDSITQLMEQHYQHLLQSPSLQDGNIHQNHDKAYGNAWKLIRVINPSSSKSILQYLANQYRTHMDNRIQSASSQGRLPNIPNRNVNGFAKDVQQYSHMELGLATSNHSTTYVTWRCLYYCLRCNDFIAANNLLQTTPNHGLDPLIVSMMAKLASSTTTLTVSNTNLLELYNRAKTRSSNSYEIVCLALLSLSESCCEVSSVITTIEDYIYVSLWYIHHRHSNNNNNNDDEQAGIAQLGTMIKQWGPTHFQDDQNNNDGGWPYAMPLLLSLQIKSALTYLASQQNPKGLLQATHLALSLHHRGIPLLDMNSTNDNAVNFDLLQSLLVAYASKWQRKSSPVAALEYLLYIPDTNTPQILQDDDNKKNISKAAQTQICRLIVETKAYSELAGNVAADGSRDDTNNCALDRHLSKGMISKMLAQAADETFRKGNVVDAAELLALAGHYSSLMSLLNRQLASLLEETKSNNEDAKFWRTAALNFYQSHLSNGRTHVLQVLEKEETLHLGNTFQLLLNLLVFFDRCQEKEWQHAWDLLDSLDIFPKNETQMSIKVESFFSLATEIKDMFHNVVLKAMESLYFQYESLKAERSHGLNTHSVSANQQRLSELKLRASLLVTFAGLLHLNCSTDTKARFARMEAFMI